MSEVVGIKETKEALVGINELAIEIAKHLKAGGGLITEVGAILDDFKTNPDLSAKLLAAVDNIKAVPDEIKDLSWAEGAELAVAQVQYVPQVLAALKG